MSAHMNSIQSYLIDTNHLIWNMNPEIFHLGPIRIRWYGFFFASSFIFSLFLMRKIFSIEGKPAKNVDHLFYYVLIGTILGARLAHCFFYDPSYYIGNPVEILKLWKGGLASHGAGIGILIAIFLYSRKNPEESFLWLLDRVTLIGGLNGFFIRLGNLFNSEIIGTPTTLPWAFVFANVDNVPRHPVQLYESLAYGLIFVLLLTVYIKNGCKIKPGFTAGLFIVLVFTARFFLEFLKM